MGLGGVDGNLSCGVDGDNDRLDGSGDLAGFVVCESGAMRGVVGNSARLNSLN